MVPPPIKHIKRRGIEFEVDRWLVFCTSENTGSFSIEPCLTIDGGAIKLAPRVLIAKAGFRSRSLYIVSRYVTRDSRPHLRHHDESIPDSERGG